METLVLLMWRAAGSVDKAPPLAARPSPLAAARPKHPVESPKPHTVRKCCYWNSELRVTRGSPLPPRTQALRRRASLLGSALMARGSIGAVHLAAAHPFNKICKKLPEFPGPSSPREICSFERQTADTLEHESRRMVHSEHRAQETRTSHLANTFPHS